MKKDFSQEFDRKATLAFLVIEIGDSGRFLLFATPEALEEYGEADAVTTLSLDLKGGGSLARQIALCLASNGLMLNRFREITRETRLSFSFMDDTPGVESDAIVLHAQVDVTDDLQNSRTVSLSEYARNLEGIGLGSSVVSVAVARLLSERQYK